MWLQSLRPKNKFGSTMGQNLNPICVSLFLGSKTKRVCSRFDCPMKNTTAINYKYRKKIAKKFGPVCPVILLQIVSFQA